MATIDDNRNNHGSLVASGNVASETSIDADLLITRRAALR
jgi:hypothetical protein